MNTFQSIDCLLAAGLITEEKATELSQVVSKLPGSQPSLYQLFTGLKLTQSENTENNWFSGSETWTSGSETWITQPL